MPADDVVRASEAEAKTYLEQSRSNPQPWDLAAAYHQGAAPAIVHEEDNGPLGNLILRPLRALGRSAVGRKVNEGVTWLGDQVDALAKKVGVVAKGWTRDQAAKQDEGARLEKANSYRAFEGQSGSPTSDEIARRHIDVNPGRQFVETSAEVSQKIAEEGTRQGAPLFAGTVVGKAGQIVGELSDEIRVGRALAGSGEASGIVRLERRGFVRFEGLEVRGVRDLSHLSESTLRAMQEEGFAARDAQGRKLVLHHLGQNPAGPLVEMPGSSHSIQNAIQHPLGNTPGVGLSPQQRSAFDTWRENYWRARAGEELARRGLH